MFSNNADGIFWVTGDELVALWVTIFTQVMEDGWRHTHIKKQDIIASFSTHCAVQRQNHPVQIRMA